jgi:hypothetical protein
VADRRRGGATHELVVDGVGAQHRSTRTEDLTSLCAEVADSGASSSAPPPRLSCPQDGPHWRGRGRERSRSASFEPPGAGEVDDTEGGSGGEGGMGDMPTEGEVEAVHRRAAGERGGEEVNTEQTEDAVVARLAGVAGASAGGCATVWGYPCGWDQNGYRGG